MILINMFLIKGRAASFSTDSIPQFVWKKFVRLIIPLFFANFLIVVPTSYLARNHRENFCGPVSENNFFKYYAKYSKNFFVDFKKCGFWWLWFLPVLFVVSVYTQPFFRWFILYFSNICTIYLYF